MAGRLVVGPVESHRDRRWRLGVALIFVSAMVAGLVVSTVVAQSDSSITSGPALEEVHTTVPASEAPAPNNPDQVSAADASHATSIISASPLVAKAVGDAKTTVTHVGPVTGIESSKPFDGIGVEIALDRKVVFPAGLPVLRPGAPEARTEPVRDDQLTTLSGADGQEVDSMVVVVNLSNDEVVAFLPGAGE